MTRRARALSFGVLALLCATLAATLAGSYRGGVEAQLGELRAVVVTTREVGAERPLGGREARRALEVRRVPARFAPVDGLADPLEAVGRRPAAPLPPGAYVTASQLRAPAPGRGGGRPRIESDQQAVEVAVTGAEALAAGARDPAGARVDVVVTTEPSAGGGDGRTYVAAQGVRLLALRESGPAQDAGGLAPSGPASWTATLAASREQALRLIQAHNYARELRLIAAG